MDMYEDRKDVVKKIHLKAQHLGRRTLVFLRRVALRHVLAARVCSLQLYQHVTV